ncbi:uncharacterized protein PF3D7_1120600 isoform X2 [Hydra vulgaris]|uniref:Uncharacterized protein PF3D7_1120600 isoform X2 n=1 Tax=Hydra vulgaris TaxID=6087 RepID=A0ABM4B7V1_HYDVU
MRLIYLFFVISFISAYKLRKKSHQGVAEARQGIIDVTVLQPTPTDHQSLNLENTSDGLTTASLTEGDIPLKIHVKHHHNITNIEADGHESNSKHVKDTTETIYTIKNSGTALNNQAKEETDKTIDVPTETTSDVISNHVLKEPHSSNDVPIEKNSYYEIVNADRPVQSDVLTLSKQVTILNHVDTTTTPFLVSTNLNEETKISSNAADDIVKGNEDPFAHLLEKLEQEEGTHITTVQHPTKKINSHSFSSKSAHDKLLEMVNELKEAVQQMQVSSETPQVVKTLSTSMIDSLTSNFHQNDNKITLTEIEDALKKAISHNEHKPDYESFGLLKNAFESVVKDIQKTHEINLVNNQPSVSVSENSKIIKSEGNDVLNDKAEDIVSEEHIQKVSLPSTNTIHSDTNNLDFHAVPEESNEHSIVNRLQNVKKILEEIINLVLHESEAPIDNEHHVESSFNHHEKPQQMHIRVKFIDLTGHDKPFVENGAKKMMVPTRVNAAVVPLNIYKKSQTDLSKVFLNDIKLPKGEESKAVILTKTNEERSKVIASIYRRAIKSVLKTLQKKKQSS